MKALGIVELNSIASGIEAADAMLKCADVTLLSAHAICAGKYMVLIQGDVAAVKSSLEAGVEIAAENLVNDKMIANLHPQVFSALLGAGEINEAQAVGIIETFSVATCITAADVAVKTSDVTLLEIRLARGLGGKAFAIINGDVAAVRSSVESAVNQHKEEGMIAKSVVIPSLHKDLLDAIM